MGKTPRCENPRVLLLLLLLLFSRRRCARDMFIAAAAAAIVVREIYALLLFFNIRIREYLRTFYGFFLYVRAAIESPRLRRIDARADFTRSPRETEICNARARLVYIYTIYRSWPRFDKTTSYKNVCFYRFFQ